MDPPSPAAYPRSQVRVKTVLLIVTVVAGLAACVYFLVRTHLSVLALVVSSLLAVAIDHPVHYLERKGMRRAWAIVWVLGALTILVAAGILLIVPEAISQAREALEQLPALVDRIQASGIYRYLESRLDLPSLLRAGGGESEGAGTAVGTGLQAARGALTFVVVVVTVGFLTIFLLIWGGGLVRGILAEIASPRREWYARVLAKIYRSVGGYLSGLALLTAINFALSTFTLLLLGIPFFLPLGALASTGSFVPFVGALGSGAVIALIALASGGLTRMLIVIGYFVVYQQVENHLIAPLVYRRTIRANPLVVLLGLIFLTELMGIVGALLAVPFVAVGKIVISELLELRRERLPPKAQPQPTTATGEGPDLRD